MKNGFCVTYDGYSDEIEMGWYVNDLEEGNFMIVGGHDYSIKFCGFYKDGKWASDMTDHHKYKNFKAADVFLDKVPENVKNEMKN